MPWVVTNLLLVFRNIFHYKNVTDKRRNFRAVSIFNKIRKCGRNIQYPEDVKFNINISYKRVSYLYSVSIYTSVSHPSFAFDVFHLPLCTLPYALRSPQFYSYPRVSISHRHYGNYVSDEHESHVVSEKHQECVIKRNCLINSTIYFTAV